MPDYLANESTDESLNVINKGEFNFPIVRPSELPLNVEFLIEHVDLKKTVYGDGPVVSITFQNEKRNLFLSKHFGKPARYERLYMLANKPKTKLMFKITKLETRDGMIVPFYEFEAYESKN